MPIFTIGHSNLSIDESMARLHQHGITAVADVRSHPYSRYLPHFNKNSLEASLKIANIRYVFLGRELGARPQDLNCYVGGKALYERIASTPEFQRGIERLVEGEKKYNIALMCAEKDPVTCHRAVLICQHLRKHNLEIKHILTNGNLETQAELEERLLVLHGLSESSLNQPVQLSLFDSTTPPLNLSRKERLKKAYFLQGDKIAYVDKNIDK
ncbi:MAG: DUF488 domain-containing protein [Cyanobacteriota bacterium]|nr:DUF488 domain-containing protein [Cyanobacteriota bacterium]